MKMVINGGSTMNVVSQFIVKRCNLNVRPYPYPFKVAWVNKTNLTIFHTYRVPIQIGEYKDKILFDVLPMGRSSCFVRSNLGI